MIVSMTGYGKASKKTKSVEINIEMRSVNSKFLEVSSRLPLAFADKENEIKEIIRQKVSRGKINLTLSIDRSSLSKTNLQLQPQVVKDYFKLLNNIKRILKLEEEIRIEHLLKFSEIFKTEDSQAWKEHWKIAELALRSALTDLCKMKRKEGRTLEKDVLSRINAIEKRLSRVSSLSDENLENSKNRLREKVDSLLADTSKIEPGRLELEFVLLADKLDVTEEVVRTKSHLNYFKANMKEHEMSGRRLNFLVQEINREINTIASKSNNSEVSQIVVEMKEELEKIKEQLQNVE
jgi:uncharacterized protein (TIGR00255 family)